MRVYMSGPISGLDREVARKLFTDAAVELAARGHEPVDPFDIPNDPGCDCPPEVANHLWACCLRKDIRVLVDCDAILMLPGWPASPGARLELMVASSVGLKVLLEATPAVPPTP